MPLRIRTQVGAKVCSVCRPRHNIMSNDMLALKCHHGNVMILTCATCRLAKSNHWHFTSRQNKTLSSCLDFNFNSHAILMRIDHLTISFISVRPESFTCVPSRLHRTNYWKFIHLYCFEDFRFRNRQFIYEVIENINFKIAYYSLRIILFLRYYYWSIIWTFS